MFLIYQSIGENIHKAFCLGLKHESEVTDKMSMLASAESHLKSSKRPISSVSIEIQTADKREVAKKTKQKQKKKTGKQYTLL